MTCTHRSVKHLCKTIQQVFQSESCMASIPKQANLARSIQTNAALRAMEHIPSHPSLASRTPSIAPVDPAIQAAIAATRAPAAAPTPPQPAAAEAATESASSSMTAEQMRDAAKAASAWMFPWERRQLDGTGPLRWYEKLYWGVFVSGLAFLLFANLSRNTKEETEEVKQARARQEAARVEQARLVRLGANFLANKEDAFEGMSPQEIEKFVEQHAPLQNQDDPFEGMSPEEINEYVEKHKNMVDPK